MDMDEWLGRLRIRFTLQHGKEVGRMHLSCSVLHTTSVVMPAWADMANKPEIVPGLVLKPFKKDVRHSVVHWVPVEEKDQRMGLGRLPILQMLEEVQVCTGML